MGEAVSPKGEDLRREIARVATRVLADEMGLHEACREIARLRTGLADPEIDDPDLLIFVAVDSELDDVPLGGARERWAPEALAEKDAQAADYLARVRDRLLRACQSLSVRWGASA
jgi:hypothetical protein